MLKFTSVRMLALMWILPMSLTASAQTTLHLASVENSHISAVGTKVLQKILQHAGLHADVISLPSVRATLEARAGRIDGEVARIASFSVNYPELIRVDPSYLTFYTVAYGKKNQALR
jgi:hypothetical protein